MDKQAAVVVIGESFLMEGIGISLQNEQALEVIQLEHLNKNAEEHLKFLQPELIIFELNHQPPATILSMIVEQPGTIFLAIDNDSDQIVEFQSNHFTALTIYEFCQLVSGKVRDQGRPLGGEKLDMSENQYLKKFK